MVWSDLQIYFRSQTLFGKYLPMKPNNKQDKSSSESESHESFLESYSFWCLVAYTIQLFLRHPVLDTLVARRPGSALQLCLP